MDDLTGQTIKGYELRVKLGQGGFGAVYRAYQAVIERDVAIKVILPQYANHPEFIRRFETEAQLVARLEHLHIVPLHDYWRDPNGAYLVMRWLQGGSLRGKLNKQGALDADAVARILDQIGSALMVAHRHRVVHRDLKPDNILLDEEGNAYLADFGIAKDIAVASPEIEEYIVGSPTYLAPEQIMGTSITPETDIYSLGIMVYELLTGAVPFSGSTATELLKRHLSEPVPSVMARRPGLPVGVDRVIQRATMKTPADRYQDAQSMAAEFRQAVEGQAGISESAESRPRPDDATLEHAVTTPGFEPRGSTLEHEITTPGYAAHPGEMTYTPPGTRPHRVIAGIDNPYKGLRAFQEADAGDFYGRSALVDQLLARMAASPFLAVVGPSGSGKSSLVRAGLIPALRQGRLPDSQYWFVADLIPGPRPFDELAAALLQVAVNAPAALSEQLTGDKNGLLQVIGQMLPDDTDLVLLIDQFEEIFTLVDNESDRSLFLDSLLNAVTAPNSRIHLILTLRADYYDRPLLYPEFGELVRAHTEVVLPLTGSALEQAIVKPAAQIGVGFEPGLLEAIVRDIGEQRGALPLLQYALTELFERRDGYQLTLNAYRDSGGVSGALARRADELFWALDPEHQDAVRQLFLRLVNVDEGAEYTRRRVQQTDLPVIKGMLDPLIDQFARYRLLTLDRDPITRHPTVEVAHEALIRTWEPLRTWLETSQEDLQMQRRLEAAAAEWKHMAQETSYLASGARLEQFEQWSKRTTLALNPLESRYLQASIDEQAARRAADEARKARELKIAQRAQTFGRAAAILAVVGLLAVIATVAAISKTAEAQNQVVIAGQTLTPVPPTLTAVQAALNLGNSQLATATIAEGQARQQADLSQTKIADANRTLTPIVQQITVQRTNLEALDLASKAIRELNSSRGNPEVAALLAIRSLRTTYDPLADSTLMQALDAVYTQQQFVHKDYVTSVAFSPDGKLFATGCADKLAHLWDLATGKEIRTFSGHTDSVLGVQFSADGKTLLTAGKDGTARLWDVGTGMTMQVFTGHTGPVRAAALSPDASLVVTGGEDMTARLWDVKTGQEIREFTGHTGAVWSVAFSPDGKTVLTGSFDLTARLWDMSTGQEIRQFTGHTNYIWSVAFSPDGTQVLTGSVDYTARLWDVSTGKELRQFVGHSGAVWAVAFSPDGNTILTASIDFTARLWDRVSGLEIRRFRGHTDVIAGAAFAPDGKSVLTASRDQTARLWAVNPGAAMRQFTGNQGAVGSVAYSPDGKSLLTSSYDGTVRLWDTTTYQEIRRFTGHTREVMAAAFAPDGKTILTGSADGTARVWDVATGRELVRFTGHTDAVSTVAFAPDGKTVLTGGYDGIVFLWNPATGDALGRFVIPSNWISSVAYSPDGKYALVGNTSPVVLLVDLVNAKVQFKLEGHTNGVNAVAFSPDGKLAVTGSVDRTAILWDVATGKAIRTLTGHTDGVHALAFMPGGNLLLTGGDDHTIRLWDVKTGTEIRQFTGHSNAVLGLAVAQDGKTFVSASTDQSVRVWDTTYQDFIGYACSRLVRDLTPAERTKEGIADTQPTCP